MRTGLAINIQRTDWRVPASALGIAAAAVLAWFLAPLIEVAGQAPLTTPSARLFAVAAVLGLASAILLAQRALAIRRNRRFLPRQALCAGADGVAQPAPDPPWRRRALARWPARSAPGA
jgi:type VI protein secretion system component VasK